MHIAATTTNVSKDAECLVDESLSLGLVTAKLHTETTAHVDDRAVESPACGFSTDLAGVNANVHIRTTVETDAIAESSVDECSISGSSVLDVKLSGFAVSDVLSPCCSVFGSLNPNISSFYPWHTKSAGIAGLLPGPSVSGSLDLYNLIFALKSAVVAGLGPGPPDLGSRWACVIRCMPLGWLSLLVWALVPVLQFLGPWICIISFLPLCQLSLLVWAPVLLTSGPAGLV